MTALCCPFMYICVHLVRSVQQSAAAGFVCRLLERKSEEVGWNNPNMSRLSRPPQERRRDKTRGTVSVYGR